MTTAKPSTSAFAVGSGYKFRERSMLPSARAEWCYRNDLVPSLYMTGGM